MFEESYNNVVKSGETLSVFAKKTESVLYPIINKSIENNDHLTKTVALIASLPVESSRWQYLDILSKISLRVKDPDFFIDTFYNEEFNSLSDELQNNMYQHMKIVMDEFHSLLQKGDTSSIEKILKSNFVIDSVKLSIYNFLENLK